MAPKLINVMFNLNPDDPIDREIIEAIGSSKKAPAIKHMAYSYILLEKYRLSGTIIAAHPAISALLDKSMSPAPQVPETADTSATTSQKVQEEKPTLTVPIHDGFDKEGINPGSSSFKIVDAKTIKQP